MKDKKEDPEWKEEMKNFPTSFPNSNYEKITDEEKKEIDEALEYHRKEKLKRKPKKIFKWNTKGQIITVFSFFLLEFLILSVFIYYLLPLSLNIKFTVINTISLVSLMILIKKWVRS